MIEDLLAEEISGTDKHFHQLQFTMTLSTLRVVAQIIPQETKHRDNISNNSTQAQELNIPDVLVNSPSCNTQSSKQGLSSQCNTPLSIMEHWMQNSQFRQ